MIGRKGRFWGGSEKYMVLNKQNAACWHFFGPLGMYHESRVCENFFCGHIWLLTPNMILLQRSRTCSLQLTFYLCNAGGNIFVGIILSFYLSVCLSGSITSKQCGRTFVKFSGQLQLGSRNNWLDLVMIWVQIQQVFLMDAYRAPLCFVDIRQVVSPVLYSFAEVQCTYALFERSLPVINVLMHAILKTQMDAMWHRHNM